MLGTDPTDPNVGKVIPDITLGPKCMKVIANANQMHAIQVQVHEMLKLSGIVWTENRIALFQERAVGDIKIEENMAAVATHAWTIEMVGVHSISLIIKSGFIL